MTGEALIAAPRDRVYAALNDIDVLRRSIPGCEIGIHPRPAASNA